MSYIISSFPKGVSYTGFKTEEILKITKLISCIFIEFLAMIEVVINKFWTINRQGNLGDL